MEGSCTAFFQEVVPRNIFKISGNSLAMQLEQCWWYKATPNQDMVSRWNVALQGALRSGNLDPLHMETLLVDAGGETPIEVPVSLTNNQFRAANSIAYPYGHDAAVQASIAAFLEDDGVFFDLGASWGTMSFTVALRPHFKGAIHAFEPWHQSADDFQHIRQALPISCDLQLHRIALLDHSGTAKLFLQFNCGGNSLDWFGPDNPYEMVDVQALDLMPLPPPNVIEMDVEGHEGAALRGAVRTIAEAHPVVLFENWLKAPGDIIGAMEPFIQLQGLNYSFFCSMWLDADGRLQHQPDGRLSRQRLALVAVTPQGRLEFAEGLDIVALPPGYSLDRWSQAVVPVDAYPFRRQAPLFL